MKLMACPSEPSRASCQRFPAWSQVKRTNHSCPFTATPVNSDCLCWQRCNSLFCFAYFSVWHSRWKPISDVLLWLLHARHLTHAIMERSRGTDLKGKPWVGKFRVWPFCLGLRVGTRVDHMVGLRPSFQPIRSHTWFYQCNQMMLSPICWLLTLNI